MTLKDRRVHLFLLLFFLLIGLNQFIKLAGFLQGGQFTVLLFQYQKGQLPFIIIAAVSLAGIVAFISAFALWTRAAWAYGFTLFSSGILIMYYLLELAQAIGENSFEFIFIVFVLVILLQTFSLSFAPILPQYVTKISCLRSTAHG